MFENSKRRKKVLIRKRANDQWPLVVCGLSKKLTNIFTVAILKAFKCHVKVHF